MEVEKPEVEQKIQNKEESFQESIRTDSTEDYQDEFKASKWKILKTICYVIVGFAILAGIAFCGFTLYYNRNILFDVKDTEESLDNKLKYIDSSLSKHSEYLKQIEEARRKDLQRIMDLEKEANETKLQLEEFLKQDNKTQENSKHQLDALAKKTAAIEKKIDQISAVMQVLSDDIHYNANEIRILNETLNAGSASVRNNLMYTSGVLIPIVLVLMEIFKCSYCYLYTLM